MIVLVSKNMLQKGKEDDFLKIAHRLVKATEQEEGCCFYRLAKDAQEDSVYYFIEAYQDEAALEAHRNSRHFQDFVPLLGETRAKPSELTKCEVVEF